MSFLYHPKHSTPAPVMLTIWVEESQGVGGFWVESDSWQHWESESDFFVRLRMSNWIIFCITPKLVIPVEMERFILKLSLKQISCCEPRFPLILTAKVHSLYVKESESVILESSSRSRESENLERSELESNILPLTPQSCLQLRLIKPVHHLQRVISLIYILRKINTSGETRGLSQGENLTERATGHCRGPTGQHSEKKLEKMMVNPDVDGYSTTLNHLKILRKTQKIDSLLKKMQKINSNKGILKPKYKLSWSQMLYLTCQGGDSPIWPPSVTSLINTSIALQQVSLLQNQPKNQYCTKTTSSYLHAKDTFNDWNSKVLHELMGFSTPNQQTPEPYSVWNKQLLQNLHCL